MELAKGLAHVPEGPRAAAAPNQCLRLSAKCGGMGVESGPPGVSQAMEEQSLRERKKLKTKKGRWWGAPPRAQLRGSPGCRGGERGNGREDGVARGGGVTGRLLWVWSPSFSVTLGADFELGSVRVPEAKNS